MGFVKLFFDGGPVFTLSVGFLDNNDVAVMKELFNVFFLGFPACFRKAFSGEEAISVPRGKRERGGVVG